MQPRAGLNHSTRGLHSGAVTGDAGQMPPLGPTPVTIHDDSDMVRQAPRIELVEQMRLFLIVGFEQFRRVSRVGSRGISRRLRGFY